MLRAAEQPTHLPIVLFASRVPAGFPSPADDHVEGRLDLNEHLIRRPAATFFVKAVGDSMRDAGIHDGDLLVIDRSVKPCAGDIVVAVLNGELTVKRIKRAGGVWSLASANPEFSDIQVGEADCEVWGVVTASVKQHCGR